MWTSLNVNVGKKDKKENENKKEEGKQNILRLFL
jgi:hypothetical protein